MSRALLLLVCLCCLPFAGVIHAATDPLLQPPPGGLLLDDEPRFLPVEQAYEVSPTIEGRQLRLGWRIASGYYLYREKLRVGIGDDSGMRPATVTLPPGEPYEDAFLGKTAVYRGMVEFSVPLDGTETLLELKSQGCADAGLCYPPRTQRFRLDQSSGSVSEIVKPSRANALAGRGAQNPPPPPRGGLLWMAMLAALGGVILNLMPCVFPVLSLKVLAIAAKGGDRSGKVLHGLLYSGGVITSFVAIAALLLALRSAGEAIGWGFHLQSPVFVAALVYLFVVMGLGLSGLIHIGSGLMGSGEALTRRGGHLGSFLTGVLATVVASPCTAPFMGTALGWAMTRDTVEALSVFAALGAGMAAPFLLLTLSPGLLARLPRPGAWMDGFKQFLAFPLYGAAVWLLWVLGKQSGVNAMAAVIGGCVLLALALWSLERARLARHPLPVRTLATLAGALALAMLAAPVLETQASRETLTTTDGWERYSTQRFDALRARGEAVFINVSADWCITCLANERVALSSPAVRDAFATRNIAYLKGDWTNSDPALTRLLLAHGRSGVPLYLYYPAGNADTVHILPQLLTPGIVLDALDHAQG